MPEDTKALDWGVFGYDDFHSQSHNVLDERTRLFDYVLDGFENGFLFFYFSSTDLNAHMFYNMIDPDHPSHNPANAQKYGNIIASVYESMDGAVGKAMAKADENTTVLILSDHGFAPFRRKIHLNTLLKNEGYIALIDAEKQEESELFQNVNWARTRAYNVGFNGLYLNLRGREMHGSVTRREKDALLGEITEKLMALRDPKTGDQVVLRVYRADEVYSGAHLENAPDLVVGFNRGYRSSGETALGEFPKDWIEDNMDAWSGDHMMAAELVPGILLSNKKIKADNPKLYDIAPTILSEFGIEKNSDMVGKQIF
jgi:predicted AlkP superfamily phosphohydrolase/phosphomutase